MSRRRTCLIGQVFVDFVHSMNSEPMMRLGGIMHAARALWAMGEPFGFAYVAPDYLKDDAEEFAVRYGASHVRHIGTISRCPNVVLVGEGKEVGSQRYEYLLRDQSSCAFRADVLDEIVAAGDFTEFLLFPGGFPMQAALGPLSKCGADIFADINFVKHELGELSTLGRKFSSLILSTSSDLFREAFAGDATRMNAELGKYADAVLLKENRGGSRFFQTGGGDVHSVPAHVRRVLHSVGVGDFFDAVFVGQRPLHGVKAALAYSSLAAAEYASHFDDAAVLESVKAVLSIGPDDIQKLGGVVLPWERRRRIDIYLAAPDFDYVDTTPLDGIADALAYHNFSPRRPVKENGQARPTTSQSEKIRMAEADLRLLGDCKLVVAVLLYDDPGTLIEIGIAVEKKIPTIVFDPFARAENLMLTELPVLVSSDPDKVIAEVFIQAAKIADEH